MMHKMPKPMEKMIKEMGYTKTKTKVKKMGGKARKTTQGQKKR